MPAYKLQGRTKFRDLDISIENKKGSVRRWYDPHGKEKGSTKMHFSYGYIRNTKGTDGDHVDVYLGPDPNADIVYIVNQMKKPEDSTKGDGKKWTKFDEQKVMLGFPSAKAAKEAYLKQYDDPRFFGSMRSMDYEEFKNKVLSKKNHGEKVAEEKRANILRGGGAILGGASIGALIGTLAGAGAGKAFGKYPGQARDYGAQGGAIVGAYTGAVTAAKGRPPKLLRLIDDAAAMRRAHKSFKVPLSEQAKGWGQVIGRGAKEHAPEAAGGALGATIMARSKPEKKSRAMRQKTSSLSDWQQDAARGVGASLAKQSMEKEAIIGAIKNLGKVLSKGKNVAKASKNVGKGSKNVAEMPRYTASGGTKATRIMDPASVRSAAKSTGKASKGTAADAAGKKKLLSGKNLGKAGLVAGGAGALYAGKKGIDVASDLVTTDRPAARYYPVRGRTRLY